MTRTTIEAHPRGQSFTIFLEPGLYRFGDPCYAMSDSFWDTELKAHDYETGAIRDRNSGELVMVWASTAYGDGGYDGQAHEVLPDGTTYEESLQFHVDSGTLGIYRPDDPDVNDVGYPIYLPEGGAFYTDGAGHFYVTGRQSSLTVDTKED